jgi:hypothetical protein
VAKRKVKKRARSKRGLCVWCNKACVLKEVSLGGRRPEGFCASCLKEIREGEVGQTLRSLGGFGWHGNPVPEINDHGAWFMVGENGSFATVNSGNFTTVNGAADAILKITGITRSSPYRWSSFKGMLSALRQNRPGSVDCLDSAWPIVWYDAALDDCGCEVEDWEGWEAALAARGEIA